MKPAVERFLNMMEERGWQSRIIPIGHLADLQEAICDRYEQGLIDEALYREQLGFFSFDPPADLPGARSIAIVAVPTPQMRIVFLWRGERVPVVVPPTYVSYTPRTESVQAVLSAWLQHEGYRLAKPRLPLKTLAVRSGLADYGRNNICYVPGMGSFLQLVGAFSDLPSDGDTAYVGLVVDGDTAYASYYTSPINHDYVWILGMLSPSEVRLAKIDLKAMEALANDMQTK